jgi:hypothetical protein
MQKKLCFKYHVIFEVFKILLQPKIFIIMISFLYISTKYHDLKYFMVFD